MLLDYTEDDLEETFCLNFTVRGISSDSVHGASCLKEYFDVCIYFLQITEENYGATEVLELIPNGENINVDKSNR